MVHHWYTLQTVATSQLPTWLAIWICRCHLELHWFSVLLSWGFLRLCMNWRIGLYSMLTNALSWCCRCNAWFGRVAVKSHCHLFVACSFMAYCYNFVSTGLSLPPPWLEGVKDTGIFEKKKIPLLHTITSSVFFFIHCFNLDVIYSVGLASCSLQT